MEKLQFKTNINCGNCVRKVSAFLDELPNITWSVDTQNPDKVLTVEGEKVDAEVVVEAVEDAGFDIVPA